MLLILLCLWARGLFMQLLWPMGLLSLGALWEGVKIRTFQVYLSQK